jgi:hypothetical protein
MLWMTDALASNWCWESFAPVRTSLVLSAGVGDYAGRVTDQDWNAASEHARRRNARRINGSFVKLFGNSAKLFPPENALRLGERDGIRTHDPLVKSQVPFGTRQLDLGQIWLDFVAHQSIAWRQTPAATPSFSRTPQPLRRSGFALVTADAVMNTGEQHDETHRHPADRIVRRLHSARMGPQPSPTE